MKITVTILDGQGLPQKVTVEVPKDATPEQIEAAIQKAKQSCAIGS